MAISVTGRVVKFKSKSELKRAGNARMNRKALSYNHIRILFFDGSDHHFLFTDKQIDNAIALGKKKMLNNIKTTWVREVWYEGVMNVSSSDLNSVIQQFNLPKQAKSYNHIRVEINGKQEHLLFNDRTINNALKRAADKGGELPKISWLSDCFFKSKDYVHGKKQQDSCEGERKEEQNKETETKVTQ